MRKNTVIKIIAVILAAFIIAGGIGFVSYYIDTHDCYIVVEDFDDTDHLETSNYHIISDSINQKQGNACASFFGSEYLCIENTEKTYDILLPENINEYYLQFWLYIDDVKLLTEKGYIELIQDNYTFTNWAIDAAILSNGWNKLLFPMTDIEPNFTTLNYFSLYLFSNRDKNIGVKVDDICLVKNVNPLYFFKLENAVKEADKYQEEEFKDYNKTQVNEFLTLREEARTHNNYTSRDIDVVTERLRKMPSEFKAQRNSYAVTEKNVLTYGRTYMKNNELYFNWTMSGFSFDFEGEEIQATIKCDGEAFLNVYIDNSSKPVKTLNLDYGTNTYLLSDNLTNKKHNVKIIKRTEAGCGAVSVSNLLTDGIILEPTAEKHQGKIEFIGDSVVCGYGNLDDGSTPYFLSEQEDGTQTYAAITASNLNAEISCVCKSGIGFLYNYDGSTDNNMYESYTYFDIFDRNYEEWDFKNHKNDVVVIALGDNDSVAPNEEEFYYGARNMISLVREKNPDSIIIWAYELCFDYNNEIIKQAVNDARNDGDENIWYYALGVMDIEKEGQGAVDHPSLISHKRASVGLTQFISELTGWKTTKNK